MSKNKLTIFTVAVLLLAFFIPFGIKAVSDLLKLDLNPYALAQTESPPGTAVTKQTTQSKQCLECHSEKNTVIMAKNKHNLFDKGNCTACHLSHNGEKMSQTLITSSIQELCQLCHVQTFNNNLRINHQPFKQGNCIQCHNPHGSNQPWMLKNTEEKLCTTCHKQTDLTLVSQTHIKSTNTCSQCHKSHSSNNDNLLVTSGQALCVKCHNNSAGNSSQVSKHQPYAQGNCQQCHASHGSYNANLLVQTGDRLCLSCHKNIDKTKSVHEPVREGQCSNCHAPHVSGVAKLAKASGQQLCFSCHDKGEKSKPVQHLPFKQGNCGQCHQNHSQQQNLLSQPSGNLCYQCHAITKQEFQLASRHQLGSAKNCFTCHENHAGQIGKLLAQNVRDLCTSCHTGTVKAYSTTKHSQIDNPAGKGACSACHKPHGSQTKPLLAQPVNQLCNSCHKTLPWLHPYVGNRNCTSCHDPHLKNYFMG